MSLKKLVVTIPMGSGSLTTELGARLLLEQALSRRQFPQYSGVTRLRDYKGVWQEIRVEYEEKEDDADTTTG